MNTPLTLQVEANWAQVTQNLHNHLSAYLRHSGLKALILGESGGIDSALTSALIRPVCDSMGIAFIGRSISIETNTLDEQTRARNVGNAFCTDFAEVNLTDLYRATVATMEEAPAEDTCTQAYKLRMGNIKARLRMIYLYNLAQKQRGMVVSTDNYSEFNLGFWTLHGDVGDYNLLYGLWKSEVYALAHHIVGTLTDGAQRAALQACIDCLPTDGLGITSTDVEQLKARDYTEVDHTLIELLTGKEEVSNPHIAARHKASSFKRTNPTVILRHEAFQEAL